MRIITYMFVNHFGRIWCFASIICKIGSFGNTSSKAWKQQTRFYWVCSWEIMTDATFLTPPSPELSVSLLSNKCWALQSQRTRKCEITILYRCTRRLFRAATRAQRQLLWSLNYLLKRILWNTASKAWKQQTRFYWVYSWEIMADATSLTTPSPELSVSLLSNKCWTLQSQRTRKCKHNNTISMYGETF